MIDGFGESYIKSTYLPNIEKISKIGLKKMVSGLMPSVTNCNNASICCGEFPNKTGITGNTFLDTLDKEEYMEDSSLVMAPTIFKRLKAYGIKSAMISSKKKSIGLLSNGVELALSPETADSSWINKLGKTPSIYSPEVNYWVMDAALYVIKNRKDISCLYIHTTDYPMHAWAPSDSNSIKHLKKIDDYIGKIIQEDPQALIFITADHDLNHKDYCVDLEKALTKKGESVKIAISAERDKYLKHHRGFGGTSFVYLNKKSDEDKIKQALLKIKGVKSVYSRNEASLKYHLMPDRIGDLIVFADTSYVFGNLEKDEIEKLANTYRSHGSEFELSVPLLIYNVKHRPKIEYFKYNKDLISWLFTNE